MAIPEKRGNQEAEVYFFLSRHDGTAESPSAHFFVPGAIYMPAGI